MTSPSATNMKMTCTAISRKGDTHPLISKELTRPSWSTERKEIVFQSRGSFRAVSYNYEITFTGTECLRFVEVAVQTTAQDRVFRAVGMGAMTSLRELLDGQPPETKEDI